MMKYKSKSLKSTVLIIVIVVALIAAANFLGIGTMRSATRIGYVGTDGLRSWTASYSMLDGKLKHTILHKRNASQVGTYFAVLPNRMELSCLDA